MQKISLTRKELERFAVNSLGITKSALRRMSTHFLAQLLQLEMNGNACAVRMVDKLNYLERLHREMILGDDEDVLDVWIVFKRHKGTNYYLTVAQQDEGQNSINQRVHDAYTFDFPFLREAHWTP